jgi:hypothetical protein
MESNNIKFTLNFVKMGEVVQEIKRHITFQAAMITHKLFFFPERKSGYLCRRCLHVNESAGIHETLQKSCLTFQTHLILRYAK